METLTVKLVKAASLIPIDDAMVALSVVFCPAVGAESAVMVIDVDKTTAPETLGTRLGGDVGTAIGPADGAGTGFCLGGDVGDGNGTFDGANTGSLLGDGLGRALGMGTGTSVGALEGTGV